mmetsp:Transcript_7505/g.10549  ORF Transcript_7505/g.10549 Transcript_7505/m.10549 type:complete len:119 (+) Transcript_7505:3559-3915(+)
MATYSIMVGFRNVAKEPMPSEIKSLFVVSDSKSGVTNEPRALVTELFKLKIAPKPVLFTVNPALKYRELLLIVMLLKVPPELASRRELKLEDESTVVTSILVALKSTRLILTLSSKKQ